ncbi:phosphoribosyltransferase [Nodosilinea sp. E11]|uniref:phosphoribosyltransferase n=1 Tax=Nodosilinea sp. E11 TaxID=3037479 RepID=UPI002934F053|nr:phosphoribosyltransferase [Nodosilinea sp. E11]WOD40283.1 phosphoribosyltransferase [Nodosilinea sp. E11]
MATSPAQFQNRTDAGRQLAALLKPYAHHPGGLVLGLPRGGVPIAYEVAQALGLPWDICLVRKLGVPDHRELAMGAIASSGVQVLNDEVLNRLQIAPSTVSAVTATELQELQRRDRVYRGERPQPTLRDRTLILVDDGIATGLTMRAAIAVLKPQQPARLIVAVPVAPPETYRTLQAEVDEVVCLALPDDLHAISLWYADFAQLTDAEVCELLTQSPRPLHA